MRGSAEERADSRGLLLGRVCGLRGAFRDPAVDSERASPRRGQAGWDRVVALGLWHLLGLNAWWIRYGGLVLGCRLPRSLAVCGFLRDASVRALHRGRCANRLGARRAKYCCSTWEQLGG